MYIPTWLLVTMAVVGLWLLLQRRAQGLPKVEEYVWRKRDYLFSLAHFDSPHFVDVCEAFDVMEMNYTRLKVRYAHERGKDLELARDMTTYVDALCDLKFAREMLDVDSSPNAWENAEKAMTAPSIVKDEVEVKFKKLLGEEWLTISPDYFERRAAVEDDDDPKARNWRQLYADSRHLRRISDLRAKEIPRGAGDK